MRFVTLDGQRDRWRRLIAIRNDVHRRAYLGAFRAPASPPRDPGSAEACLHALLYQADITAPQGDGVSEELLEPGVIYAHFFALIRMGALKQAAGFEFQEPPPRALVSLYAGEAEMHQTLRAMRDAAKAASKAMVIELASRGVNLNLTGLAYAEDSKVILVNYVSGSASVSVLQNTNTFKKTKTNLEIEIPAGETAALVVLSPRQSCAVFAGQSARDRLQLLGVMYDVSSLSNLGSRNQAYRCEAVLQRFRDEWGVDGIVDTGVCFDGTALETGPIQRGSCQTSLHGMIAQSNCVIQPGHDQVEIEVKNDEFRLDTLGALSDLCTSARPDANSVPGRTEALAHMTSRNPQDSRRVLVLTRAEARQNDRLQGVFFKNETKPEDIGTFFVSNDFVFMSLSVIGYQAKKPEAFVRALALAIAENVTDIYIPTFACFVSRESLSFPTLIWLRNLQSAYRRANRTAVVHAFECDGAAPHLESRYGRQDVQMVMDRVARYNWDTMHAAFRTVDRQYQDVLAKALFWNPDGADHYLDFYTRSKAEDSGSYWTVALHRVAGILERISDATAPAPARVESKRLELWYTGVFPFGPKRKEMAGGLHLTQEEILRIKENVWQCAAFTAGQFATRPLATVEELSANDATFIDLLPSAKQQAIVHDAIRLRFDEGVRAPCLRYDGGAAIDLHHALFDDDVMLIMPEAHSGAKMRLTCRLVNCRFTQWIRKSLMMRLKPVEGLAHINCMMCTHTAPSETILEEAVPSTGPSHDGGRARSAGVSRSRA